MRHQHYSVKILYRCINSNIILLCIIVTLDSPELYSYYNMCYDCMSYNYKYYKFLGTHQYADMVSIHHCRTPMQFPTTAAINDTLTLLRTHCTNYYIYFFFVISLREEGLKIDIGD